MTSKNVEAMKTILSRAADGTAEGVQATASIEAVNLILARVANLLKSTGEMFTKPLNCRVLS